MAQIALPLGPSAGARPARILVGQGNSAAVEALSHPENWPFRSAILFGPPRSGKTLLARWFADSGKGLSLDDADQLDETDIFHRWNAAQETGTPLLLTVGTAGERGGADVAGAAAPWQITLPDLASRAGAALPLRITAPDDAMLGDLIALHAEARHLALGDEAIRYLVTRGPRCHMGVERLVATIDRLSLERKAPPGPAIWREALEEVNGPSEPRLL